MKLKKQAVKGEIIKSESKKFGLCWNGFAWERVKTEEITEDTLFVRTVSRDVSREAPAGVIDGVNFIFELEYSPLMLSEQVFLNGLLQKRGSEYDYTIVGSRIYFVEPPMPGSTIQCNYVAGSSGEVRNEKLVGLADGENSIYTLSKNPISGSENVFLNGLLQREGVDEDYVLQGNVIIFAEAPLPGSTLLCNYNYA